jgi:MYXO-CTERM domain-containing protein
MVYVDSVGQEVVDYSNDGLGRAMEGYLQTGPFLIDLSGVNQGSNFECVRLRSRGANAALSAPVTLCGRDAPTLVYRGSSHIECHADGLIAPSEGGSTVTPTLASAAASGCGVAGSPASGSWSEILVSLLWAALAALGWPVRRRRTAA